MTLRIMETVSSALTEPSPPNLLADLAASSQRPFQVNHHGDSEAKNMRIASSAGTQPLQRNWNSLSHKLFSSSGAHVYFMLPVVSNPYR